jgi:hypothetical protein
MLLLLPLLCAGIRAEALAEDDAAPATRPTTEAAQGRERVTASARIVSNQTGWAIEVTLMNSSKENVTVPRGPRSISMSGPAKAKQTRVGESVLSSPGGMWLSRHVGTVSLQPNEGFVKRVPIEELPPGRYRIEIKLPDGFERIEVRATVQDIAAEAGRNDGN